MATVRISWTPGEEADAQKLFLSVNSSPAAPVSLNGTIGFYDVTADPGDTIIFHVMTRKDGVWGCSPPSGGYCVPDGGSGGGGGAAVPEASGLSAEIL